jgi:rhodanese-related sulfurtransferase
MTMSPRFVTTHRLRTLLAEDPELTLIDVRTPDEFEEAHILRARNFPLGSLVPGELLSEEAISRNRPVYLVCHTDNRSKIAAEMFLAAGHPRVYVVSGGTVAWIAAALPVIRRDPKEALPIQNPHGHPLDSFDRKKEPAVLGRPS